MAIVSGPTPPGTGVSAPATSATRRVDIAHQHRPALLPGQVTLRALAEEPDDIGFVGHAIHADVDDGRTGLDERRA